MKHSTYLAGDERAELERWAIEHGTSLNYGIRLGVRLLLGMPVPRWARANVDAGAPSSSSQTSSSSSSPGSSS